MSRVRLREGEERDEGLREGEERNINNKKYTNSIIYYCIILIFLKSCAHACYSTHMGHPLSIFCASCVLLRALDGEESPLF